MNSGVCLSALSLVGEALSEVPDLLVQLHVLRRRGDPADAEITAPLRQAFLHPVEDLPQVGFSVLLAVRRTEEVQRPVRRLLPAQFGGFANERLLGQRVELVGLEALDAVDQLRCPASDAANSIVDAARVHAAMDDPRLVDRRSGDETVRANEAEVAERKRQRRLRIVRVDEDDLRVTFAIDNREDVFVREADNVFLESLGLRLVRSADLHSARREAVFFEVGDDLPGRDEPVAITCRGRSVTRFERSQCGVVVEVTYHGGMYVCCCVLVRCGHGDNYPCSGRMQIFFSEWLMVRSICLRVIIGA